MFVSAFALSASLVQCDPVSWNSSAVTTWIKVARSSTPISQPLNVTFTQAVTTMSAQETLASGGGSLTIFGGGFTVGGTYECDIRVQNVTVLQVVSTPESPNQFTCILGPINERQNAVSCYEFAKFGTPDIFFRDKIRQHLAYFRYCCRRRCDHRDRIRVYISRPLRNDLSKCNK